MGENQMVHDYHKEITFFLNNQRIVLRNPDPEQTLAQYLRSQTVLLTGTKISCYEGGCGAFDGCQVITVEGLGSSRSPHPIQTGLAEGHATQCGFCSPGFTMSLYGLLKNKPNASTKDIEDSFDGNLCRCTGYRSIYDSAKTILGDKEKVCSRNEPSFPSELENYLPKNLKITGSQVTWIQPTSLDELLKLRSRYPHAPIVNGNTEVSLKLRYMKVPCTVLLSGSKIPELTAITTTESGIHIGPAVTVSKIRDFFKQKGYLGNHQNFKEIAELLKFFGSEQIRNIATIGGNICEGKRQSDFSPIVTSCGCKLTIANECAPDRVVDLSKGAQEFFIGKRTVDLHRGDVVKDIFFPFPQRAHEYFIVHKQATRRDDDITIVTGAFRVAFNTDLEVSTCQITFSGMHDRCRSAPNTEQYLIGKTWDQVDIDTLNTILLNEDYPEENYLKYGQVQFRKLLCTSFFYKFFMKIKFALQPKSLEENELSVLKKYQRPPLQSSQHFQDAKEYKDPKDIKKVLENDCFPVGSPVPHMNALPHATGEAIFVDDMPDLCDTLHATFVLSKRSYAKIVNIDKTQCLKMPGVVRIITAQHIPNKGRNKMGDIVLDEPLLANEIVQFHGQPIAMVLAKTRVQAQRAAMAVEVEYSTDGLPPACHTIKECIAHNRLYEDTRYIKHGDPEAVFEQAQAQGLTILEGEVYTGSQEHFYLETQSAYCVVTDPGQEEMVLYSSTQNPSKVQEMTCLALGIPFNRLEVKSKRVGGGFGGKETQSVWIGAATCLASMVAECSVRVSLERDEDMLMTGKRHAFLGIYKCAYDKQGKVHAAQIKLYANGGYSYDVTMPVIERALFHADNAYCFKNFEITGLACQANLPTSTAFRGFGSPQAVATIETMFRRIAHNLSKDCEEIRPLNFYHQNDTTYYGMPIPQCNLQPLWEQIKEYSQFEKQRAEVLSFNRQNRHRKRGISIIPLKYGFCVTAKFMNQAGALVHIYLDGSVRISIAGTELGQGLYTKCCQVAANQLGVPLKNIHIAETSTSHVPNTMPTVASIQSDLSGNAVINACEQLKDRLDPYLAKANNDWYKAVEMAYFDRVNLSANGFYATEDLEFDWKVGRGKPFNYFGFGVACSCVEIDALTGDYQIIRSDIIYDVGNSLSPAIDIGQIEGAFMQGVGLFTLEELVYWPNGQLFNAGPGLYKIPSGDNIPHIWNIHLAKDLPNTVPAQHRLYGSKGIGEPPLILSFSVLESLRNAVASVRIQKGNTDWFDIKSPFTAERIRNACL